MDENPLFLCLFHQKLRGIARHRLTAAALSHVSSDQVHDLREADEESAFFRRLIGVPKGRLIFFPLSFCVSI